MNTLSAFLIVVAVLTTSAVAQEKAKPVPSRNEVLRAVEVFVNSPLSAEGKAAAATIANFAEESEDITIVVSSKVVTWLESANPARFTLFAAYVVGNVKSQLEHRSNADDPYAGLQQVLKTYAQLKSVDKNLRIPEVEKFVDLEAKKQLKQYVEDALKKGDTRPAK